MAGDKRDGKGGVNSLNDKKLSKNIPWGIGRNVFEGWLSTALNDEVILKISLPFYRHF